MKILFILLFLIYINSNAQETHPLNNPFNLKDTARTQLDTIKVRIQIDDGPGLAVLINGYLVRKFISYGNPHPIGKMFHKERFTDENYFTINNDRIWGFREKDWKHGEPKSNYFIIPKNVKGL